MRVIGIDPGSLVTGYGVVEQRGGELWCLDYGVIRNKKDIPFPLRLQDIYKNLKIIFEKYRPDEVAIETIFYAENVSSALKLGHARGVAILAAVHTNYEIFEYSPMEIKQSVTGYGRAQKEQVRSMVKSILRMDGQPFLDSTDALAVAICHINSRKFNNAVKKAGVNR